MRIAITADLHWGTHDDGDGSTRQLLGVLQAQPPDLFILAGDQGAGQEIEHGLELFAELPCQKALIAGNHDLWVTSDDDRGDSLDVFDKVIPNLCQKLGYHNLDKEPLVFPADDLAIVGSINWYDYSWTDPVRLANFFPEWQERLQAKRFTRGRHNDGRFIRWNTDDAGFTKRFAESLERQIKESLAQVNHVIVVTHHPPLRELQFPKLGPPTADGLMWDAFSGNTLVEELVKRYADRIPFVFCGHTHRARHETVQGMECYNIGSDYGFKRLLTLDWPNGAVEERQFDV